MDRLESLSHSRKVKMAKIQRIGVLTSGGDGPGLNPCIRAVTRTAVSKGIEVVR